jgi:phosphoglycolate phosphatase-like HAD superfamily hydrolase
MISMPVYDCFDWSRTLNDDLIVTYRAHKEKFKELGGPSISLGEYMREFELPFMNFYRKYFPNITKEDTKGFTKLLKSAGNPKPFPFVEELLRYLDNLGKVLSVISSDPPKNLQRQILEYGLEFFFDDEHVKGKVHDKEEELPLILDSWGFPAGETVYIGDQLHDIEAGKKAGVQTVAVCWYGMQREAILTEDPGLTEDGLETIIRKNKEMFLAAGPDYYTENPNELKEILT